MVTVVSTHSLYEAQRLSLARQQRQFTAATKEAADQRKADPGLDLGSKAGETVSVRQTLKLLEAQKSVATGVSNRLDVVSAAMEQLIHHADTFKEDLISMKNGKSTRDDLVESAAGLLEDVATLLNQSYNGDYIFGGENSDGLPFVPVGKAGSSSATAVANALAAAFPSGVATATPAQTSAFLSGGFAALFTDADWSANWSGASAATPTANMSADSEVEVGVSAFDRSIRDLVEGLVMIGSLGLEDMGEAAADTVVTAALAKVGVASDGLTSRAAAVGRSATRVESLLDVVTRSTGILESRLTDLEGVDATEAATRLSAVQNQLNASMKITARIYDMSLLDYI